MLAEAQIEGMEWMANFETWPSKEDHVTNTSSNDVLKVQIGQRTIGYI